MEGQVSDRRIYREGLKNKKKVIEKRAVDGTYSFFLSPWITYLYYN